MTKIRIKGNTDPRSYRSALQRMDESIAKNAPLLAEMRARHHRERTAHLASPAGRREATARLDRKLRTIDRELDKLQTRRSCLVAELAKFDTPTEADKSTRKSRSTSTASAG